VGRVSDAEQPSRRPRTGPVVVASLGVLAAHALLLVVPGLVSLTYAVLQPPTAGPWFGALLLPLLLEAVPFALGVFICLRFIVPIAPQQGVLVVIGRGAIATLGGAVLVAVASLVTSQVTAPGSGMSIAPLLASAAEVGIRRIFIVVLAAVLLWIWVRRHPLDAVLRSAFEEV
jgi:hypothetical protein